MTALLRSTLTALASLRLTVALFAMAMFLIFAGTLAQVHAGIWQVMAEYFRTPFAWIELQLFIPQQLATVPGRFPFPGGYLLGGLLIINLLAAHAIRFRLAAKRIGIITLHLGIIVLLLGEFVTGLFAEEGLMTILEGESAQYVEDVREAELVILDRSGDDEQDRVTVIPERMLTTAGQTVDHPALPFTVTVDQWLPNARLFNAAPDTPTRATRGAGRQIVPRPEPLARGIDGNNIDMPAAFITLHHDGRPLGTWLVAELIGPSQTVEVDGRTYHLDLRFKRTYKPYTLHLIEFTHERFVGTERPRNFASRIRLVDPTRNADREVVISMNSPLRYAGATFYQSAYLEQDTGTVLQVVRNPGWLLPYIACGLVALGMLIHFGQGLWRFAGKVKR
ncbi:cytochrome c biogenesis protein ResB [Phycisphaerales bacterium AB-hyl4]|uniref:Cytochrome c biogenesis protein ResB n=1 Tax=Natronomicrosphaera hydrolytica TaxID=3242702 RepID=A0ABV4U449_9BACT